MSCRTRGGGGCAEAQGCRGSHPSPPAGQGQKSLRASAVQLGRTGWLAAPLLGTGMELKGQFHSLLCPPATPAGPIPAPTGASAGWTARPHCGGGWFLMQPREPAGRRMAGRSSGLCSFCPGGGGALSQGASLRDSVFSPPLGGEGPSSGGEGVPPGTRHWTKQAKPTSSSGAVGPQGCTRGPRVTELQAPALALAPS